MQQLPFGIDRTCKNATGGNVFQLLFVVAMMHMEITCQEGPTEASVGH